MENNFNEKELEEKIRKFDEKCIHYVFTIFFSMVTAIIVTLSLSKLLTG